MNALLLQTGSQSRGRPQAAPMRRRKKEIPCARGRQHRQRGAAHTCIHKGRGAELSPYKAGRVNEMRHWAQQQIRQGGVNPADSRHTSSSMAAWAVQKVMMHVLTAVWVL